MNVREALLNLVTVVAATCAVVLTIQSLRQGKLLSSANATPGVAAPRDIPGWERYLKEGHRIGSGDAVVQMVEFGDFECPACAAYAKVLNKVKKNYPNDLAIVFRHMPLDYHHLAYPLARAAECAASQERFPQFYEAVYAHPESLGLVPMAQYGARAGVADTLEYGRCVAQTTKVDAIERDIKLSRELQVPGTPGLIVDGKLRAPELVTQKYLEDLIATKKQEVRRRTAQR